MSALTVRVRVSGSVVAHTEPRCLDRGVVQASRWPGSIRRSYAIASGTIQCTRSRVRRTRVNAVGCFGSTLRMADLV